MQRTACRDARFMINTKHAQAIAKKLYEKAVQVVGNIKIAKWPSMFTSHNVG